MKYKLEIVSEDKHFIGYALLNDEVVFQTEPHKDSITASRELSKLINSQQPVVFKPSIKTTSSSPAQPTPVSLSVIPKAMTIVPASLPVVPKPQPKQITQAPRRCCGRG